MHKDTTTIAKRYAVALFECLDSDGKKEAALTTSEQLLKILSDETASFFAKPVVSHQAKADVLSELISKLQIEGAYKSTLELIHKNGRLSVLRFFVEKLSSLLDESLRIERVEYSTATEVSDSEKKSLEEKLEASLKKKVRMSFRVNESLNAGCVLKVGNKVIDMSLKSRIGNLKEALSQGV